PHRAWGVHPRPARDAAHASRWPRRRSVALFHGPRRAGGDVLRTGPAPARQHHRLGSTGGDLGPVRLDPHLESKSPEEALGGQGKTLPPPNPAVANYVMRVRPGPRLFVAGPGAAED